MGREAHVPLRPTEGRGVTTPKRPKVCTYCERKVDTLKDSPVGKLCLGCHSNFRLHGFPR